MCSGQSFALLSLQMTRFANKRFRRIATYRFGNVYYIYIWGHRHFCYCQICKPLPFYFFAKGMEKEKEFFFLCNFLGNIFRFSPRFLYSTRHMLPIHFGCIKAKKQLNIKIPFLLLIMLLLLLALVVIVASIANTYFFGIPFFIFENLKSIPACKGYFFLKSTQIWVK